MANNTRQRIVNASAELFRRQGYTGTGLKQIVVEAEAPFGSLYHFFPGGKQELGAEVIRLAGQFFERLWYAFFEPAADPAAAVEAFFAGAAQTLIDTDFADACPIATVALEVASTNEMLRQATADVFDSWIAAGTACLAQSGIPAGEARQLAIGMLAGLEGAFVLSRASRTTEPVVIAGAAAAAAVRSALDRAAVTQA